MGLLHNEAISIRVVVLLATSHTLYDAIMVITAAL